MKLKPLKKPIIDLYKEHSLFLHIQSKILQIVFPISIPNIKKVLLLAFSLIRDGYETHIIPNNIILMGVFWNVNNLKYEFSRLVR